MTNCIGAIYSKIEAELSQLIGQNAIYHEN